MTQPTKRKAGVKALAIKTPKGDYHVNTTCKTQRQMAKAAVAKFLLLGNWSDMKKLGYRCVRVSITEDKS